MCVLCEAKFAAPVCVLQRSEEHTSGAGVTGVCEPACPTADAGNRSLEEQEGILTTDPALQHQAASIYV